MMAITTKEYLDDYKYDEYKNHDNVDSADDSDHDINYD